MSFEVTICFFVVSDDASWIPDKVLAASALSTRFIFLGFALNCKDSDAGGWASEKKNVASGFRRKTLHYYYYVVKGCSERKVLSTS